MKRYAGTKIASETRAKADSYYGEDKSIRIPTIRISQNPVIADWQRKQ